MPRRRPPGAGPALRTSNLFAILLVLPWISTAAQQQHPPERAHSRSPLVEARLNTDVPPKHGKHSHQLDDSEYQHSFAPNYAQNVRAVATTVSSAPAVSAVRAPPARNAATSNNLERPRARSLQDWLVEDFVLLATVDGHIHARDRYTGDPIWELSSPKPMLEVTYNKNNSDGLNGWQDAPFLWIVEPKEDGALYVLTPGAYPKLQPLGMTIKQMTDEMNPYTSDDPPVVYTAKKESSMFVVDARTGNVTKIFSPSGSMSIDAEKCKTHGPDYFDSKESDCRGTLNLGQTDYTISIHNKDTLDHVCTIKYSEWTPNNRDRDLQSQYAAPMDQHYIYSRYNGNYLAYDHKRPTWRTRPVYERKLPYPVARVFDVARGREEQDPEASLILLPQPLGPAFLEDKAKNVWLNTTDMGSWYALSESSFPAVTDGAPVAPCYMHNSLRSWDGPHFLPPRGGLVGVHELDYHMEPPQTHLAIAGPTPSNNGGNVISIPPEIPRRPTLDAPPVVIKTPPQANWSPMMWTVIALVGCLLVAYQQLSEHATKTLSKFRKTLKTEATVPALPRPYQPETPAVEVKSIDQINVDSTGTEEPIEAVPAPTVQESKEKKVTFDVPEDEEDEDMSPLSRTTTAEQSPPVDIDGTSSGADASPQLDAIGMESSQELGTAPATPVKKKKTHRGKRGGQKGKNKKPKEGDEMDQIVDAAKHLNEPPALHPDEITPYGADMQDVSNVKKIGKLTIDFDRVLGNGSGGTFVFEGKWNVGFALHSLPA
jgi:serine/threonine-protein kinase/endoribonuclease IRE1